MKFIVWIVSFKLAFLILLIITGLILEVERLEENIQIMKIGYEANAMLQDGYGEIEKDFYHGEKNLKKYGLKNYNWRYPFLIPPLKPIECIYVTGEKGYRNIFGYWEHVNSTDFVSMKNYLVYNMAAGEIKKLGKSKVYGNYVIVKSNIIYNEENYVIEIRYSHLSLIYLKKGDYVEQDQEFAVLGNTGRTNKSRPYNGVHLDLEININGVYVNPFNNTIWHKRIEL